MKNAFVSRLTSLALALSLSLPLGAMPVAAQEGCWDNLTIQSALAEGRIQPVAAVLSREGIDPSTRVTGVRVCEQGGAPVYVISVLEESGQARDLTLNAQ